MSLYLRSLAAVCLITLCALLGSGCRHASVYRYGAQITPDARTPQDVLGEVQFGGKEKPPYVYGWSPVASEKRIGGLTYHGFALHSSPIPRLKAIELDMPSQDEIDAVVADPTRRLVEIYAHRFEEPERWVDIRLSCRIGFFLEWDFEEFLVRDANTGRLYDQGAFWELKLWALDETGAVVTTKEKALMIFVTFAPGDYELEVTAK